MIWPITNLTVDNWCFTMQNVDLLVNEVQLGSRLAKAVSQHRASDFSMMLAMMSHNVLDSAQFCLPSDSVGGEDVDEAKLRQQLGLGQKPAYSANDDSATQSILLGVDLHTQGMRDIKLKGYLQPEPLARVDDRMHIEPHVIGNCEPTVMQRYYRKEDKIAEKLDHDEAGLYEVLESMKAA